MTGIQIRGVSVQFESNGTITRALHEASLSILNGERVALVGRNGSGKSTLLRVIAGLQHPNTGAVAYPAFGKNGPTIGWMPQDYRNALYPWWSVDENLTMGGSTAIETLEDADTISEVMKMAGIELNKPPFELSGGQQQIVAFLRAAFRPGASLVLLDEPFSALDVKHRIRLRKFLRSHTAGRGQTLVVVTHDLLEAARIGDRVVVLSQESKRTRMQSIDANSGEGPLSDGQAVAVVRRIEQAL